MVITLKLKVQQFRHPNQVNVLQRSYKCEHSTFCLLAKTIVLSFTVNYSRINNTALLSHLYETICITKETGHEILLRFTTQNTNMSLPNNNVSEFPVPCTNFYIRENLITSQINPGGTLFTDEHPLPVWARAIVVVIVTAFIIISNIINVVVLRRVEGIPRIARVCLINLGIADLAVGAITCLLAVAPTFLGTWPYGAVMCQISSVVHGSSATVSVWTLSIISVDRYIALVKPLKYPSWVSLRRLCFVMTLTWTLAIGIFLAPLATNLEFNYYQYNSIEIMCGLYWEYPLFGIITVAVVHVASATVIVGCTIKIAISICHVNKVLNSSGSDSVPVFKRKRDHKAVRTLVITALAFFLFWGPYVVSILMYSFDENNRVPPMAEFVFVWMANSNSFINVVIYSYLYETFRNQIKLFMVRLFPFCKHCVTTKTVLAPSTQEQQDLYQSYQRRASNVRF